MVPRRSCRFLIIGVLMLCLPPLWAGNPLPLRAPTPAELAMLATELGDNFINGSKRDPGPPKLLVAVQDLNLDGFDDVVASQRSRCSNVSCDYEVLMSSSDGMQHVATLSSWNQPEVALQTTAGVRNLILYKKVSYDCSACSPPVPVLHVWSPATYTADGNKGTYIWGDILHAAPKKHAKGRKP